MTSFVLYSCGVVSGVFLTLGVRWLWESFLTRYEQARYDAFNRALSESVRADLRAVDSNVRKGGA